MKQERKWRLFLCVSMFILGFGHARAPEEFLNTKLNDAREKGDLVLLHFYAGWCTMCRAQKPILEKVMVDEPKLRKVITLVVAYDDEKELWKEFGKPSQSTLVVLKGKNELARSSRLTHKDEILEFLKSSVPSE